MDQSISVDSIVDEVLEAIHDDPALVSATDQITASWRDVLEESADVDESDPNTYRGMIVMVRLMLARVRYLVSQRRLPVEAHKAARDLAAELAVPAAAMLREVDAD